jgi:flagellar motor switch protein FliN/FliY
MADEENLKLQDLEEDTPKDAPPDTAPDAAPDASGPDVAKGTVGGELINDDALDAMQVEAFYDIPVQVSAVLGKATMEVNQLLKLGRGAVVELDRKVGEAIDVYVNNRLVARGEVVVVDDKLGITMTEIIKGTRPK